MTIFRGEPDLSDIMDNLKDDVFTELNCHRIGVIQSFNPSNQTATIKLVDKGIRETPEGDIIQEYSLLQDCPVLIAKSLLGGLTIPINQGDTCLVVFNDRDIDNWFSDGLVQKPNTARSHDFSDAIAIVGIRNLVNQISDYNNTATEINYENNKIILDTSNIKLINNLGGQINIDDKLELKNTAENLKLIIDDLITALTSLQCVDPVSGNLPIDGATASNLSALSTRLNALLK
jgi:hypothetical protein